MKICTFALLALIAMGTAAVAQEDAEFTAWMKTTNAASGTLRKMEKKILMAVHCVRYYLLHLSQSRKKYMLS